MIAHAGLFVMWIEISVDPFLQSLFNLLYVRSVCQSMRVVMSCGGPNLYKLLASYNYMI
jgi:hypothetical protein